MSANYDDYAECVAPGDVEIGDDIWDAVHGEGLVVATKNEGLIQIGRKGADGAIQRAAEHVIDGYRFEDAGTDIRSPRRVSFAREDQVRRRPVLAKNAPLRPDTSND